jgi:hypothetical protein
MTYYRGTTPYQHPDDPTKSLCYIRNKIGWRVCLSHDDAKRVKPFDLFQNYAGGIECKNVLGKQFPLSSLGIPYSLFRHVVFVT